MQWSQVAPVKEPAGQCSRRKRCRFDSCTGKICGVGNGTPLQYSCLENSTGQTPLISWATEHTHRAGVRILQRPPPPTQRRKLGCLYINFSARDWRLSHKVCWAHRVVSTDWEKALRQRDAKAGRQKSTSVHWSGKAVRRALITCSTFP